MNHPSTSTRPTQANADIVHAFVDEYFEAWQGTDEDKILDYYSDDVVIHVPIGKLDGKAALRDSFVRPFIAAFPGNVHLPLKFAHAENLVAVEWEFKATHRGPFADVPASGRSVSVPGCSFYEYDLERRVITAGRIYFDFGALLRQIRAKE